MTEDLQKNHTAEDEYEHRHVRRIAWGWWFFAVIALFYLLTEHQAHLFGALPYLFLLACPLMHFFMHGHHGGHEHHDDSKNGENRK